MKIKTTRMVVYSLLIFLFLYSGFGCLAAYSAGADWTDGPSGTGDWIDGAEEHMTERDREPSPVPYGTEEYISEEHLTGAGTTPVVALSHIPDLGKKEPFEGIVFMEDGSDFYTDDYHVTLYLQGSDGLWWVKPSYDTRFVTLDAEGCFSISYTSGGDTDKANFRIILLPEDHEVLPTGNVTTSALDALCGRATDFVEVTRSAGQGNTVTPQREAPDFAEEPAMDVPVSVADGRIAVDVGFYTEDGQEPGSRLSEEQIRTHLDTVKKFSNAVRFYNAGGDIEKAYEIANEMGLCVVGMAYLGGNEAADKAELDALIDLTNRGLVQIACVGNETLLETQDRPPILTPKVLIEYIQYVRDGITETSVPVTTSDSVDVLMNNSSVRRACNLIFPNCYPFWGGSDISGAPQDFINSITALQALCGEKQVVVSEAGWPTGNGTFGSAVAGEAQAAQYFEALREWSVSTGTVIFYFASADEPWKAEGGFGSHFGFMTNRFRLKDAYANTTFFTSLHLSGCLHSEMTDAAVEPTCTKEGLTEGVHCRICGKVLTAQQKIAALGHDWSEWTTVKEATKEEEGLEKRICRRNAAHEETRKIARTAPVLVMTQVPKLGEREPFEGFLYMADGSAFSPEDYHVTMYLQGSNGSWWVKPSAQNKFVIPDKNGCFSISYISGGDTDKTNFRILLLPKDHEALSTGNVPTSYIDSLCENSLDFVRVQRAQDGGASVEPLRTVSIEKASVSGVSLSYGYTGKEYKPAMTVKVGSITLVQDRDYTVSYENNKKPGTAKITISGKGAFTGTRKKTFEIVDCVSSLVSGKTYQLIPKNNSKTAVCSYSGKMVNNTKVYITDRSGSEAMKFKAVKNADGSYKFINAKCELALAVQKNSREAGTGLVLYDQTTKKAQNWKLSKKSDNSFAIINADSELSVAMSDASAVKGTTLSVENPASSGLQRFYITETDAVSAPFDGTCAVRASKDRNFALNIASSSKEEGANVNLQSYSNTNVKKFKVMYSGGGYYRLVNVNSGLCLTVKGNTKTSGANVIQGKWRAESGQRWKIVKNSDGTVTLTNALGTVLHLVSNKTANGTNIVASLASTSKAQKWYIQ